MPIFKSVGLVVQKKKKVKDYKIFTKVLPSPPWCSAPGESTVMVLAILVEVHMLIIHANIQICQAPSSSEEEG